MTTTEGRPRQESGPHIDPTPVSSVAPTSDGWTPARGLSLRRQASLRLVPLDHECGTRDPLWCRCGEEPAPVADDPGDYWYDSGMDLGWPERVAAGHALLAQQRGWAA